MVYAIQHPFTGKMLYPSNSAHWRYKQEDMLEIMRGWCDYELKDLHDEHDRAIVCGVAEADVRPGVLGIVLSEPLEASAAKVWKLTGVDGAYYKEWFASLPSKQRVAHCKQIVRAQLSRLDAIQDRELGGYIDRVMDWLTPDQLAELERSPYPFVQKIKEKILALLTVHAAGVFELWLEQGVISCLPSYSLPSTTSPTEVTSAIPKSLYSAEEKMNDFEIRVVWGLSALDNVKWWHRNISRLGFCVNGFLHAYPDIIVMTTGGKLLLVETKGDHLDNAESEQKARIGDKWEAAAGKPYKYFMVFDKRQPSYPRAFALDRFMEIVKGL